MQTVDDTQLIVLARKPAAELFVSFRRIGAFAPLLTLLCLLPPVYALTHASGTDADALWGLRALCYVPGDWPPSLLRSPEEGVATALRWQPPLGTWVTAGIVDVRGSAGPLTLLAPSFAATVASIAMLLFLFRSVASERLALWAVILGAGHAPLLLQSTHMAPIAIGMFLALASFWGFLSHLEWGTRQVSVRLVLGGISLGLCSLAAGPLAIGTTAAMLLFIVGLRGESLSRRKYAEPRPIRVWRGWSALRSLGVMLLIAVAAGGFWTVNRWWHDGGAFLSSWLFGTVPADSVSLVGPELLRSADGSGRPLVLHGLQSLLEAQGPLLPASLGGFGLALRGVATFADEKRRRTMLFLVSWVVSGLLGWLLAVRRPDVLPHILATWECYLSVGLTACGACFLEEISLRHLRLGPALSILLAGVMALAVAGRQFESLQLLAMSRVLIVALFAGLVMILASYLREESGDRDSRQQVILTALVLAVIAASVSTGIASLRRQTHDDRALTTFRRALPRSASVTHCTVLGDPDRLPPRLRLAVQASWPPCAFESSASWDDAIALALTTPDRQAALILDWGRASAAAITLQAPGVRITPVTAPQIFAGGALRASLVQRDN